MTKPIFEIDDLPSEPIAKLDAEKLADTMAWSLELENIIAEFKDSSSKDPLNKDEIDDLIKIIRAKIELIEGLTTEEEYNEKLDLCSKPKPAGKKRKARATKFARIVFENPVPSDMTREEAAEILQSEIECLLHDHGVLPGDIEIRSEPYTK